MHGKPKPNVKLPEFNLKHFRTISNNEERFEYNSRSPFIRSENGNLNPVKKKMFSTPNKQFLDAFHQEDLNLYSLQKKKEDLANIQVKKIIFKSSANQEAQKKEKEKEIKYLKD